MRDSEKEKHWTYEGSFLMGRKGIKIPNDIKLKYAKLCYEGRMSITTASLELGVTFQAVAEWVCRYRKQGSLAFEDTGRNRIYSEELRKQAVCSYLRGEGSQIEIAAKYGLKSSTQLNQWIKRYNNGDNFSHKMSGGSHMKTPRKTTLEERIQIVKECIANDYDYGQSAITHSVSYQQVYGWVRRFKELGEAGLEDRRGQRKTEQVPRSEIEELQIKLAQLEQELTLTRMERDLLKKAEELQRKEPYHK